MNEPQPTWAWRERRIDAAGVMLTAFEAGSDARDAPTLVLLHGLGHWTEAAWDRLVPLLDPHWRIVALDLPGFGSSDKPTARYDTAFFARVIGAALDEVSPHPFVLCGHSLGGFIAANEAAARPERLRGLILIAPAGFLRAARFVYSLLASHVARWALTRRPTKTFVNRALDRSVRDPATIERAVRRRAVELSGDIAVRRAFAAVYRGAIADFAHARALHDRLRAWHGPTLVVWGRHDAFIPVRAVSSARAVYPQATVLICESSAHLPMVEEPHTVARAMRDFLDQLDDA